MDNQDLLTEIQFLLKYVKRLETKVTKLEDKMDTKFKEIEPYVNTLEDIKSSGRIFSWVIGVFMALGGAYVLFKQIFH